MPDTLAAAQQFFDLCKAGLFLEVLLCVVPRPTEAEIERQVKRAVGLFLKAYAAADPRVRLVGGTKPGPTTKAECLNRIWLAMLADERGIM